MLSLRNSLFAGTVVHANVVARMPIRSSQRFFSSDADMLRGFKQSQVIRTSPFDGRADSLIKAIRHGEYDKARRLVQSGVNVNGHNEGENTPLTDAAKRGDTNGVRFLLNELKANPSASCGCPNHETALHYAAMNGHKETVKVLLENGAQPNVLNASKLTALDVSKTTQVKQILIESRGAQGKQVEQDLVLLRKYLPK